MDVSRPRRSHCLISIHTIYCTKAGRSLQDTEAEMIRKATLYRVIGYPIGFSQGIHMTTVTHTRGVPAEANSPRLMNPIQLIEFLVQSVPSTETEIARA